MQQPAAGGERSAYVITLGPGGSVSEMRRVPASSLPSSDNFSVPLELLLSDEDGYDAVVDPLFDEVDRSRSSKRASAAATIEGLVQVPGASRFGEDCPVCLHNFSADETLRAMPCSHAFHYDCISQWLRRNPVCPLCRRHLLLPDDDDKEEHQHQNQRRRTTTT